MRRSEGKGSRVSVPSVSMVPKGLADASVGSVEITTKKTKKKVGVAG